jgi:hypothetical protein
MPQAFPRPLCSFVLDRMIRRQQIRVIIAASPVSRRMPPARVAASMRLACQAWELDEHGRIVTALLRNSGECAPVVRDMLARISARCGTMAYVEMGA